VILKRLETFCFIEAGKNILHKIVFTFLLPSY